MSNSTHLVDTLRTIGPNTRLELTWDTSNSHTTTTGIVTAFERGRADRRIETDDRTLQLTRSSADTEITVAEVTLEGTTELGTLQDLDAIDRPVEQLRLTDAGVEVPPYYVGYDGFLTIIDSQGRIDGRILGGLNEYDDRLLTGLGSLLPTYDEQQVEIAPWGGPTRCFEIIDQRSTSDDTHHLAGPPMQVTSTTARLTAKRTDTLHPNRQQETNTAGQSPGTDRPPAQAQSSTGVTDDTHYDTQSSAHSNHR